MPRQPRTRFALTVVIAFAACAVMIGGALLAAAGHNIGLVPLFAVPVAAGHAVLRLTKTEARRDEA
jgi:CHASE2 domain-containing sensor protein